MVNIKHTQTISNQEFDDFLTVLHSSMSGANKFRTHGYLR